jgi:hypothetical protein
MSQQFDIANPAKDSENFWPEICRIGPWGVDTPAPIP